MSSGDFGVPQGTTGWEAAQPGISAGMSEGKGLAPDIVLKFLRGQGLSTEDAKIVRGALPDMPSQSLVSAALEKWRMVKPLVSAGYSKQVTSALATKLLQKPVGATVAQVLDEVKVDKPDLAKELGDIGKALTNANAAPGGAENPADPTFTGKGPTLSQLADDSFLSQLRTQAKNFLTAADLQYLASVGSPDEFLQAMVRSEGAQAAQVQLGSATTSPDAVSAGISPEGDITASSTRIAMTPEERSKTGAIDAQVPMGSRIPRPSPHYGTTAESGGKSVTEAVRMLREMNPQDLMNLERKLVDAGYYAQVMSGQAFEPDVWGDPTDPATNAAWKALLRDTIGQKTDVQTLLATRASQYGDWLGKQRSEKAKTDARAALADALTNQVTVSDTASLRVAASKIAGATDSLGKDLAPNELDALASWIQGLQASTQFAAKHGASRAVDIDPVSQMTERIAAQHPVEMMGQRVASQADEFARLLRGPGA